LGWAFNPAVLSDMNDKRSEEESKPNIKFPAGIFTILGYLFSSQDKMVIVVIKIKKNLIN
tara:strand:- start:1583 stop:1762 length:180 start_codon:yes stop_codon:yes gene_type:complete